MTCVSRKTSQWSYSVFTAQCY